MHVALIKASPAPYLLAATHLTAAKCADLAMLRCNMA
jgi:hypothetical protein